MAKIARGQVTIHTAEKGEAGSPGPAISFRGAFSAAAVYCNNALRRDVVKYTDGLCYIYKGAHETSGAWNANNWESFGASFESVATGLLLVQESYIENLVANKVKTALSGERITLNEGGNNALILTNADGRLTARLSVGGSDGNFGLLLQKSNSQASYVSRTMVGCDGMTIDAENNTGVINGAICVRTIDSKPATDVVDSNGVLSIVNSVTKGSRPAYRAFGSGIIVGQLSDNPADCAPFRKKDNNILHGLMAIGKISTANVDMPIYNLWISSIYPGFNLSRRRVQDGICSVDMTNSPFKQESHYMVIAIGESYNDQGVQARYVSVRKYAGQIDFWQGDDSSPNGGWITFMIIDLRNYI